jgi:hypothetical protein
VLSPSEDVLGDGDLQGWQSQNEEMCIMRRKRTGVPWLVLTGLVLLLWLVPTQSDTAAPDRNDFPLPFDEALLHQDLISWMSGKGARHEGPISSSDVTRAMSSQPNPPSDLFGRYDMRSQHEVLRRVPYGSTLVTVCERNRVDPLLIASIVEIESQFAASAVSSEGAVGLMQLLPSTGKIYGVHDLLDPVANLDAGSRYYGELRDRFDGDDELALAAYNTGPEVVARYRRVPPYRETRNFVRKVMALYRSHQDEAQAISLGGGASLFAHHAGSAIKGAA